MTSGDIDAIPLHMYAIVRSWPRHTDSSFLHDIYVLLQKPKGKLDLYDVTAIVSLIEKAHDDTCIAMKVSSALSIRGNDFIPKYSSVSHTDFLMKSISQKKF